MLLKTMRISCSDSCRRTASKFASYSAHRKCIGFRTLSTSHTKSKTVYTENLENLHRSGVRFGQPTQFTHPHLLKPNELTTGLLPTEFAERRQKLMEKIMKHCVDSKKPPRNIVIIPASQKKYMTGKIPYFFRQNTDFFYLTGCLEPDTVLVLWTNDKNQSQSALFMRSKNSHDELWDGPRTGHEHAIGFFGVDEAYPLLNLTKFIGDFLNQSNSCNIWYDNLDEIQSNVTALLRPHLSNARKIESPMEFLHELRLNKSPAEIDLMRKTCKIASKAINTTMQKTKPGDSEHFINARVDFHCRMKGAQFLAYPPVVAAGNNANIIHYINNTQAAEDGDLVLMDAGCEYGGYSSDITRTWPVNGKFTEPQKILYEIVYLVQNELLNAAHTAENYTLDQLFELMCHRLGKYLQEIVVNRKLLSNVDVMRQTAFQFCPHHVSHYLGMDIHDTPLIRRTRTVVPGMVFTVEPGLYIPADCKDVHEEFRGIGIRIEDDIHYTNNGIEILTQDCIKQISDLEKLCSK